MNNINKEFLIKEIERLEEELSAIRSQLGDNNETYEDELDIEIGDYLIYTDTETEKLRVAEIVQNEDFNYNCYYPFEKLVSYCAWQNKKELYDDYNDSYEDLKLINLYNEPVYDFELDREYFLYNIYENIYHITKCVEEGFDIVLVNKDTNENIAEASHSYDLFKKVKLDFDIIKEIRNSSKKEYTVVKKIRKQY